MLAALRAERDALSVSVNSLTTDNEQLRNNIAALEGDTAALRGDLAQERYVLGRVLIVVVVVVIILSFLVLVPNLSMHSFREESHHLFICLSVYHTTFSPYTYSAAHAAALAATRIITGIDGSTDDDGAAAVTAAEDLSADMLRESLKMALQHKVCCCCCCLYVCDTHYVSVCVSLFVCPCVCVASSRGGHGADQEG